MTASLIEEIVAVDHEMEAMAGGRGHGPGERRHGLEAGGGQDRGLVGGAGGHRRCGEARRAVDAAAGVAGVGTVVVPRAAPPAGPQAVDRLRGRLVGDGRGGRRGQDGPDRAGRLAPARRGDRGHGAFDADAAVEVAGPDGQVFAKGLTRHPAHRVRELAGRRTSDLPDDVVHEVVHRDDLVLLP